MRAIARFAVICVSLLISLLISPFLAAQAGAAGPRTPINALDFQERGARLRLELERAYQEKDHSLVAIKADPAYDSLREDAGFQGLLKKMKLN